MTEERQQQYRGRGGKRGGRGGKVIHEKHKRNYDDENTTTTSNNNNNDLSVLSTTEKKLMKPKFTTVEKLEPGTKNLNLVVKVVKVTVVAELLPQQQQQQQQQRYQFMNSRPLKSNKVIAEVVVGDATGTVILSLSSQKHLDQIQNAFNTTQSKSIVIRGARIDLFKGNMRLKIEEPFGVIQILSSPDVQKLYSEELLKTSLNDSFTVNTSKDVSAQTYKVVYEEE